MNIQQAKEILLLSRPGGPEEATPDFKAAMAQVEQDPELERWYSEQRSFHTGMRQKFRRVETPAFLKARLLAQPPSNVILWWRSPTVWALAASIMLLISFAAIWLTAPNPNSFAMYRTRMAKTALRDYRMDLVTNDLNQIRAFLTAKGPYGNYVLEPPVAKLPGVGCALLKWHNHPVSLICFSLGGKNLLWLFVTDPAAVSNPPRASVPQIDPVGKLITASWTQQGKTYLLALVGNEKDIQKYLAPGG